MAMNMVTVVPLQTTLVLHVDLNNTILVSDAGTSNSTGDSPSLLPSCECAVCYHSQFAMLYFPEGDKELAVKGEDGQLYHWSLASSFQLLKDLVAGGKGLFHLVPYHWLRPSSRILCSKKVVVLTKAEECLSTRDGEKALYQYLSSVQGLGGFQDHFDWWARNTYIPSWEGSFCGGTPSTRKSQHIFIDDNIRQNDEDTVAHPKVCFFSSVHVLQDGLCILMWIFSTSELYDLCLVQNDRSEPCQT
uniref:Si:dkey-32e6.3 n=1 Tax=Salmo trutta TaxID=8032 RepID=A0A674B424_SALTR